MKIKGRTTDPSFLAHAPMEEVVCRLCGCSDVKLICRRDCIGLPVRTVMCGSCGLIFINPRPTEEWYKAFYSSVSGHQHEYRQSEHTSAVKPIGAGFDAARRHGRALAGKLGRYMHKGVTIDVGSSEGGVLQGFKDVLDIIPIGIEPVPAEAEYATSRGITTHAALIENIETLEIGLPPADNIVCVKSLNHILNPAYFFSWAWHGLKEGGRLVLEVKNFRHQVRRTGRIYSGIQLDHPYMFLPETLTSFVRQAGFDILFADVDEGKTRGELVEQKRRGLPSGHIRVAGVKSARSPFSVPFVANRKTFRDMRNSLRPLNLYFHYLLRYANIRKNIFQ